MHLLVLLLLAKDPLSLEELKALSQQKSHLELLERAEDVAPSARSDAWKELVAAAATQVIQSAARDEKHPFAAAAKSDALKARFPFLEQREPFTSARDEAVINALKSCNDTPCLDTFVLYEKTLSPAGSLAAGKAMRRAGFVPYRPIAVFARAASNPAACSDADLADATIASLDTPEDSDTAKAGRQVAFESCWSALQPKLRAAMVGASPYRLANACKPMRAKKALSAIQDELCKDVDL